MKAARASLFGILFLLGLAGMCSRWADVFVGGGIYFLDPDCYSRMTRVKAIREGAGWSIRHHAFENAPEGVTPHTTAPMDWILAALALAPGDEARARDLAGAFVSPILGAAFLALVGAWCWRRRFGAAGFALAAFSPILAHSFSVGRPDHQSLLLLLLAGALVLESHARDGRARPVALGLLWGVAWWVSLFEPLVLLVLCLAMRWVVLGRKVLPHCRKGWLGLAVFFGVLSLAVAVDGWRLRAPAQEVIAYFPRWAAAIGELQPAGFGGLAAWVGWLVPVLPAWLLWRGRRDRQALAAGAFLAVLVVLSWGAARWGPYLALGAALTLPAALASIPAPRLAAVAFAVSLWPVAAAWDRQLFPEGAEAARRHETRIEGPLLREIAGRIGPSEGTVLAPWWLCPAIAYWSGQPCVAGSSHQSLPGIVATARFFQAGDDAVARGILRDRQVEWVVSDDPRRVLENAGGLLGAGASEDPMAERLAGARPPPYLRRVAGNAFFKLFQVDRAALSRGPPEP